MVGPTSPTTAHRQVRGAYVNVQEDEGKTVSGTSTDERDCTDCVGRLEARCTLDPRANETSTALTTKSPLLASKSTCRTAPGTVALAPSNKVPDPNKPRLCLNKVYIERSQDTTASDENHPPELASDSFSAQNGLGVTKVDAVPSFRPTNLRLDFERSTFCPRNLRPTGNTPKLSKKLLVSDLDTPNFCRKVTKMDSQCNDRSGW